MEITEELLVYCRIGTAVLFFGGLIICLVQGNKKELILNCFEMVGARASKVREGIRSYEKWEEYLLIHGADFHFGSWMNPATYLIFCMIASLTGCLAGMTQSILFAGIGAVLGALIPGFLVEYLNRQDNEEMLPDLNLIYHALSIQIRAGVYISDALAECYTSVNNKRLKKALLQLSGEIVMKSDMEEALTNFQKLFSNKYIDALCMTISQAAESGQAVELLGDIAEQIKDMELLTQNRKKQKLDRSITFYELGLFAAIIVLVIYICIEHLFQTDMFVSGGLL